MARQIPNGLEPGQQADRDERPAQDVSPWDDVLPRTPDGDEELVADARRLVTPGQMVERKLLALLGGGAAGRVAEADGGQSNPRRVPGGRP